MTVKWSMLQRPDRRRLSGAALRSFWRGVHVVLVVLVLVLAAAHVEKLQRKPKNRQQRGDCCEQGWQIAEQSRKAGCRRDAIRHGDKVIRV